MPDGTNTLTYDSNGNLTSDAVSSDTWDRANRLKSVGATGYQYDGLGNRVQQTVSSVVTDYLLDVQPGLAVVLTAKTGANTTRYVHGPRGIHAQEDNVGAWTWMAQDGLGSVRGVVTSAGAVLESRLYNPHGESYGGSGTNQTPYGFTGEPTDGNGLLYLRERYLRPALAQFVSLDPLEVFNRYAYVDATRSI